MSDTYTTETYNINHCKRGGEWFPLDFNFMQYNLTKTNKGF